MSEYVSVADLPSLRDFDADEVQQSGIPPLHWEFSLPPTLDAERLEINMAALRRYHAIGAITSSIVAEY